MRTAERGFLLLTSPLGDTMRKPLTVAQFRTLAGCVRTMEEPRAERELVLDDLLHLGYEREFAYRILHLLSQEDLLDHYLTRSARAGCSPVSRISPTYPRCLREKLDPDSPASLWTRGDLSLLEKPKVALVGSRDICPENRSFAWEVGTQAARQGYVLVSGNARGADQIAQTACRRAGGEIIVVVADELETKIPEPGTLYLSEDGFDLPFTAQRALSRNRLIHALAEKAFVAQCSPGRGGTWDGTVKNLQNNWCPVFCFADGSDGASALTQMGAEPVKIGQLQAFSRLTSVNISLFDQ